jgi:hypothetical protein
MTTTSKKRKRPSHEEGVSKSKRKAADKQKLVSTEDLRKGKAIDGKHYVKFPGIDVCGFDHDEWKQIPCKTFAGALNIGIQSLSDLSDPDVAVAWCSKRQMAWIKVDAHKHRPQFSNSEWSSGEHIHKVSYMTMIYFFDDLFDVLEEIALDIIDEMGTPDPDWKDRPRSFSNPANVEAARALLQEPHVRPLTDFVEKLRRDLDKPVPDIDPLGGGVNARVLFLMEAPSGAGAGRGKMGKVGSDEGSGMICPNNDDPTGPVDWQLKADADMRRNKTVVWNACPYYVGTATKRRKPTMPEVIACKSHFLEFMKLLKDVRVVLTCGQTTRDFWRKVFGDVKDMSPTMTVIHCRHPHPLSVNQFKGARPAILRCYKKAAELADKPRPDKWQHYDRSTIELALRKF